jgi:hypothetical protein
MSLVVGGEALAGTERVLGWAETGLRFAPPYPGCARRRKKVILGVGHWTGGEAGTKTSMDDGKRVYEVLRGRVNERGEPTPLSVHFTIGFDGTIWQYADPSQVECFHASAVNDESWGVEIVNAGFPPNAEGRSRPEVTFTVHGRKVRQLAFTDEQLTSYVWLCDKVNAALGIPRAVPGKKDAPTSDRIATARLLRWSGQIEHLHCSSKKLDGGTQLTRALLAAGYAAEQP